jgi:hypothetical protein
MVSGRGEDYGDIARWGTHGQWDIVKSNTEQSSKEGYSGIEPRIAAPHHRQDYGRGEEDPEPGRMYLCTRAPYPHPCPMNHSTWSPHPLP